jgi:hypothetical protein
MKRAVVLLIAASLLTTARGAWSQHTATISFTEIGAAAGVRATHRTRRFPGSTGDVLRMFTSGGAAVAVGDYDNDGFDDLFVTDSDTGRTNHLFHNDGNLRFSDVAQQAGVAGGNDPLSIVSDALWFDYDNDGWRDLLVARFGTPILYHNEHGGKFKDVSSSSGLNKFGNTIAAIAFDFDNDGSLDLLFGNYFKAVNLIKLPTRNVLPNDLDNAKNGGGVTLWRNTGRGSFVEVTSPAGFSANTGWTLDAGHGDFNNDGFQDVYLAADYGTDRLYMNNGDGTYKDVTATALGFDTKKGMNVDVGDYDNDGWLDIYVTNITDQYMKECNMLWHNNGNGTFSDVSRETATCNTLWGWAAKFADLDNDGWLDIFAANGLRSGSKDNYIPVLVQMITRPGVDFTDVKSWPPIGEMSWSGYQKKKLFRNLGVGSFVEISAKAGVDNDLDGRGIGIADFDNDGRLDIYQTNADQPALLYRNDTRPAGNWIELKLIGSKSNRDAIGSRVKVKAGSQTFIREVDGGNAYASQSMARLHFGLAGATKVDMVEIRWPSGDTTSLSVPLNQVSNIEEGVGITTK